MFVRLGYVSHPLIPPDSAEMGAIRRVAASNNAAQGLTGALYFDGEVFFQVLEGEAAAVGEMLGRVRRDPRHREMRIVERSGASERLFAGAPMKLVDGRSWAEAGEHRLGYGRLCAMAAEERAPLLAALARA